MTTVFNAGRLTRFGPPLKLFTDQGSEFESARCQALTRVLDTVRQHTTAPRPTTNRVVEWFHRQLKAVIIAHDAKKWTAILLTILLGFRAAWKDDLQASISEILYGSPIWLPGEFLLPQYTVPVQTIFVGQFK